MTKIFNKSLAYRFIVLSLITLTTYACNKSSDKTMNEIQNLKKLKTEPKFVSNGLYTGLENKSNEKSLSDLLDNIIDDFSKGAENNFTDEQYQNLIKKSLMKFDSFNLDTEDREYICGYFEKIMDAIGLESSGGALNEWLYGFKIE
ncbi:hypothetical protein C1637_11515 [Chryseobacterium lactis]|uniref:DUF4844 domain-containing protein n=2 Tax=Chryseobacterium lactis TaxID=1241981 RepID=A0A3G6RLS1_CHRLC|nr:DUF4844 domain-containing protein [Chryseobacterium lactis]AZA80833.1 DUF4844 domain-containing protein [Chryseobacterium lactis]AZB05835.1 DUF4844 domain-containing protein [Chryseobacterium lactis]PNW13445.1 hypothetical protein C1637_11515 [Chryseobacterium lactis]